MEKVKSVLYFLVVWIIEEKINHSNVLKITHAMELKIMLCSGFVEEDGNCNKKKQSETVPSTPFKF